MSIWRRFETQRYWFFYYAVYLMSAAILAALDFPYYDRQEWASLLTVAAGLALASAMVIELGVRAMLLIPDTIKKIRKEGQRELLDALVKKQVITSEQRRDFEIEQALSEK